MKAKSRIATGWYLQRPFSDPDSPQYFDRQNWWSENRGIRRHEPDNQFKPFPISNNAATYELVRRHSQTGELLLGQRHPDTPLGRFIVSRAQIPWPRLTPDDRYVFGKLVNQSLIRNLTRLAHDKAGPVKFTPAMSDFDSRRAAVVSHGQSELAELAQITEMDAKSGRLILSVALDGDQDAVADAVRHELSSWQELRDFPSPTVTPISTARDTTLGRLEKITRFEQTELERFWDFEKARKGRGRKHQRREPPLPRKVNQNERRAFERVCEAKYLSFSRPTN